MKAMDPVERSRSLRRIVRGVRRRWRIKLLLKGGAIVFAIALAIFVLSSWALERAGFSPAAVVVIPLAAYAIITLAVARFLLPPLLRRVEDERAALYLEEHEPDLQALVLSALELEGEASPGPDGVLARRTIEDALDQCARIRDGGGIERGAMRRFGGAFAGVGAIVLVLTGLQPVLLRHGAGVLFHPFRRGEAATPYAIEVRPGDATVPRGADVPVHARLRGFAAGDAQLVVRTGRDSAFQHIAMSAAGNGEYELVLFGVREGAEYFVEAGGVRSGVYRIEVADLPYTKSLSLEYRFPGYTGRPPERVEEGGDVAALIGTTVHLTATTTVPAAAGDIVLSTGQRIPLRAESGAWTGDFVIRGKGLYHLELATSAGQRVTGSPEYTIDALEDRPPTIRLSKPGRDTRPTPIDEVMVEAQAEDDYGVRTVDLVYAVNGGPEKSVEMFRSGRGLPEVTAGHTLYLEEMKLQPGDVVSYYARAKDASPSGNPVTSDIYFLTARPYGRDYRQADSGPQQGAGQQGQDAGDLTRQQREIVAATFNLARDSARYTPSAFREYLNTVALMQDRLRAQVRTLAQQMRDRQVTTDSMFARIAEILPRAAGIMDTAVAQLRGPGARPALPPEQRALRELERAEALYRDVQVQFQTENGGGQGQSRADDLADLFEMEADQVRNQYETLQRGEREQTDQKVDATVEKLRELAQRLQQENERLRRLGMQSQAQAGSGNGGAAQRQLAQELEQAARQLERLSRDRQQQPELDRASREVAQAADALRRGAAQARSGNSANAQEALERLQEATRRLQEQRGSGIERDAREALRQAQQLADDQRRTGAELEQNARSGGGNPARTRDLIDRRTRELARTSDLEQELDRLAAGAHRDQPAASKRLQQAADAVRQSNLKEMESFSRNLARDGASPDVVRQFEGRIAQAMDSVVGQVRAATGAFGRSQEDRAAQGLDRARDLVRGLESMRERTRDATEEAEARAAGRQRAGQQPGQPSPGQQGQQGQRRQAGQESSPGQAGRQAQGGGGRPGASGGDPQGGAPGAQSGQITPEQARQLRAEARQRLAEAQALRQQLQAEGRDVGPLDGVISGLQGLDPAGAYSSAADIERIQGQVVEGMKAYEFALRRAILGEGRDKTYLAGSDEVPANFRKLVEEYYRRLAGQKP